MHIRFYIAKSGRRWLTFPLTAGWLAAYRVVDQGTGAQRRTRIRELRIVPGLSGRHAKLANFLPEMGSDVYERQARAARRTLPPFSFTAVRRKITQRFFADALAALSDWLPPADFEPLPEDVEPSTPKRRAPGRPARDPRFYAKLAVDYHLVEHGDRREAGASTRATLARRYKVPITTIGKWIRIARQHKFLTPVRPGQRGGQATRAAQELARSPK